MNKTFLIQARLEIEAKDEYRAIKAAHEAIEDGLIEPGFVKDGYIEPEQILELNNGEQSDNMDE